MDMTERVVPIAEAHEATAMPVVGRPRAAATPAAEVRNAATAQPVQLPAAAGRTRISPAKPPWSLASGQGALSLDRAFKAQLARLTFGLSPAVLAEQTFDWMVHLAISPGKRLQLAEDALRNAARLGLYAGESAVKPGTPPCVEPRPTDRRFAAEAWQRWPFNLIYQAFLLNQQWWNDATTGIEGVSRRNERSLSFTVRQALDIASPSNFILTNPEIAQVTIEQGGRNLLKGLQNLVEDCERTITGQAPSGADQFIVGQNVAITPGKVVLQNRLMELIQYAPSTEQVHAEPVLIVPAWIMKYYILDLSPQNSLVKYLVDQRHTVFMISWKNPGPDDRDLGMDDYRKLGVMAALDAIAAIAPGRKVHAAGYCLGGTMLTIAAATMGRDLDERLASMTLFAAQADFTEAGELMLFINESQISYLENLMWDRGYLDPYEMAGAFNIIRSNDLVWSRVIREYLMGGRQPINDLMAWNADTTRLPYRMHSEYLRQLFLNNDLAEGRYCVEGRPISIADIRIPTFAVGTAADHVAPWRSVFKTHLALPGELAFVLTSGGHNAGIVSEPGHPGRTYQFHVHQPNDRYVDPDTWRRETPVLKGSWWPEWHRWLARHSSGRTAPPPVGAPDNGYPVRGDAPGLYVRQS
ncbi:PHA/PHB synthase family protein [Bradyrhizobium sp. DASA03120]|uniref:PHA/PHB synthase family protein n=1 Tax=Bradyrhizobium sp. SMVTL-02 TaxID=3395917 RepID=UPI003F72A06D